jgi:V/A-type H+-transporting ATPase subunit C
MTGLEYGNTRLRARRSRLLGSSDYVTLLAAESLDRLLGLLSDTTYGPAVAAALTRYRGIRRLDEALRVALATEFRAVRRFYADIPVPVVDLLLERWDLHNLRTILRAKARTAEVADLPGLLVPAGTVTDAELRELADQPGVRSALDLMVAWGLPSADKARRVASAWPEYERRGDVSVLERVLSMAYAEHLDEVLRAHDGAPSDSGRLLRTEIDRMNVMAALRLRRARLDREPGADDAEPKPRFLPGGRIRSAVLEGARSAGTAADAAAVLAAAPGTPGWDVALAGWIAAEDLGSLDRSLRDATTRHAVSLFHRGDPLGPAIPVAYVFAKENEVRNLRWIGQGIAQGLSPDDVAAHLLVAT